MSRSIGDEVVVDVQDGGGVGLVTAYPVQTGVDDDAVQPAADRSIIAERARAAVRSEHRVLERVGRVLGVAAGEARQPVQLAVVAIEQLLECIAVPGRMCGQ